MPENNTISVNIDDEDTVGKVQIADHVVAVIAGVAATETEGVISLVGNITNEIVTKMGFKLLSKGVKVNMVSDTVFVDVTINVDSTFSIPKVCQAVQEKVVSAVETMTGLSVAEVNVMVADVTINKN